MMLPQHLEKLGIVVLGGDIVAGVQGLSMAATDDPCHGRGDRGTMGLRRTADLAKCVGDVGVDWVSSFGRYLAVSGTSRP